MRNENASTPIAEVIEHVTANPAVAPFAKLVGRWVWVEFDAKPGPKVREFLKAEGFFWNRKRGAWQHSGGRHTGRGADPKGKYGEMPFSALREEESHVST